MAMAAPSKTDDLRADFHAQLHLWQWFHDRAAEEASPAMVYGIQAYTAALNDTIRALKRETGHPLRDPHFRISWPSRA